MSTTSTSIGRTCPFVGPRPFHISEPLFGRDREVPKLLDLVIAERIVLLFSPSGAGKTSLIQAGLIPALREESFHDLPVIRVGLPPSAKAKPAAEVRPNRYVQSVLASLTVQPPEGTDERAVPLTDPGDSLEPALRRCAEALSSQGDGRRPRLVLIFDQFEEILTTDPTDRAAKEVFFDQLGAALKDPALWALFALREEYVAALEPYLNRIPRRLASRFRLDLLGASPAREAFAKPLESRDVSVAPEAATRLVDDLRRVLVQRPDGTSEVVLGPHVEPVHLQIVGLRLWNSYGSDPTFTRLDEIHLSGTASDVDAALADYYADKVREIGKDTGVGERTIREWCEHQLLTDQGLRGQVLREPRQTRGLPEPVIKELIDAFLVRAEERRGSTWYELAHDRLIEPVRTDNQGWRQHHLHPSLLRATDWDRTGQRDGLLLRGAELKDAESWAETNAALLTDLEGEFLDRSRKLWDEERSRRWRKWIKWIKWILTATFILAFVTQQSLDRNKLLKWLYWESKSLAVKNEQMMIDHGISLCQQGQTSDGLLWLMRGLERVRKIRKTTPDLDALDHLVRLELAAWRAELTSLRWFRKLDGQVYAVAFSPDSQIALTGSWDGTARLWDVDSGQPKGPPLKHDGPVDAVAFSPDGQTALTGSWDGTARLWDAASGAPKGPPLMHAHRVNAVAFSPDGRTALTGGEDSSALLWDVDSGQPKGPPLKHDGPVRAVAFSPDGRTALTGSGDRTARLWDVANGKLKIPPLEHFAGVDAVAFSPDGRIAITGSDDWTVRLWDVANGKLKGPQLRHDGAVRSVVFSPDGRTALTGSDDRTARLWDVANGKLKEPPLKHDGPVDAVAFSPDGRTALTGGFEQTVRLWDVGSGPPKGLTLGPDHGVGAVAFSPDGRTALTGSWDGTARLWDVASGEHKGKTLKHNGPVRAVAFSPDGQTALTGSWDGTARLWDAASGAPKGPPLMHAHRVNAVAFSPDGRTALTGGEDSNALLWDVDSGQPKGPPLKHNGPVRAVAFSPDGRTALTGDYWNAAKLWDVASGEHKGTLEHDSGVLAVAFSPDGQTALTGGLDGCARLWNVQTREPKGRPLIHGGAVRGVAYSRDGATVSRDGATVLTLCNDGTAQLWLADTQRPVGAPISHPDQVRAVAYSPDGRWIATACEDGTTRLWETPTAVEGSLDRLAKWVSVVTRKELGKFDAARSLDLEAWQKARQELDRLGGPPDRPSVGGTFASRSR